MNGKTIFRMLEKHQISLEEALTKQIGPEKMKTVTDKDSFNQGIIMGTKISKDLVKELLSKG